MDPSLSLSPQSFFAVLAVLAVLAEGGQPR